MVLMVLKYFLGVSGLSHWIHESQREELADLKVLTANYKEIRKKEQVIVGISYFLFHWLSGELALWLWFGGQNSDAIFLFFSLETGRRFSLTRTTHSLGTMPSSGASGVILRGELPHFYLALFSF